MKKVLKNLVIFVCVLIILIILAVIFYIKKSNMPSEDMFKIIFTNTEYAVVQEEPEKIIISKNKTKNESNPQELLYNYMKENGFEPIDRLGSEHYFSNEEKIECVHLEVHGYYSKWIWKNSRDNSNFSVTQNGIEYKRFKPNINTDIENPKYDVSDYTRFMEYEDKIYYQRFDTYEDYSAIKRSINDIIDMSEEDFNNYFMVLTAVENTSMLGLGVDKIDTDNDTLYISLKIEGDRVSDIADGIIDQEKYDANREEYSKTCISYKIPKTMNKEKISVVRNLRDDEKDFSTEMKLAYANTELNYTGLKKDMKNLIYFDERYRSLYENKVKEPHMLIPIDYDWKNSIAENFTIEKNTPEIDFSKWENLGNDYYALRITDFSEYKKFMEKYNVRELSTYDFKNIFSIIIVRANAENSIKASDILDDNLKLTLQIITGGILDVEKEFKYPGIAIYLPNYMSLEKNKVNIEVD